MSFDPTKKNDKFLVFFLESMESEKDKWFFVQQITESFFVEPDCFIPDPTS